MPVERPIEVLILKEKEYQKLYKEAWEKPKYTDKLTKEMHDAEFAQFDRTLRRALSAKWEEDACGGKDFAIMDAGESSDAWHHCGGIYSTRICCPDYVETIARVIAQLPHAALWTYHTACEVMHDDAPLECFGEFFIRTGKLYAAKDGNDYADVFRRKR